MPDTAEGSVSLRDSAVGLLKSPHLAEALLRMYEDELVRVNGEWKFKYRNIRNEFLAGRASRGENPVLEMDRAAEGAGSFSSL